MDPLASGADAEKRTEDVEKTAETQEQLGLNKSEQELSHNLIGEKHEAVTAPPSSSASDSDKRDADSNPKSKSKSQNKSVVKSKDAKAAEDAAFAHLPEHEKDILRRQLHVPETTVTYFTLFRYATTWDLVFLAISAFCAIVAGAVLPLMTVVFGGLTGTFGSFFQGQVGYDDFSSQLGHFTLYFVYIAIGEFVTVYISTVGFIYVGEHVTAKIREHYLAAILRQNIGFFDKLGAGEITTRITADTNQLQEGISEKVGLTLTAVATFVAAFVIGFVEYWKLTLIMCSVIVAITLEMGIGTRWIVKNAKAAVQAYAEGGTVAEEVLSSIRNAVAFGTEDKLAKQYEKHLEYAAGFDLKQKSLMSILWAGMMCVMYLSSGLAFWMGSRFIVDGEASLNQVITISFAIIIGAFSLGNVGPNAQSFTGATAAATKIFATIDRASPLDPTAEDGKLKLEDVRGEIELRNIKHIYPSRAEVVVMDDVNLVVPSGKTTALVGASGSGKSTIVGLVERFYDPVGGEVLLDGHNVQGLNLKWLRQQISLVQQEPTLFSTTIFENIRHGLLGTKYESASEEEQRRLVEDAAKQANAHQFVSELPEGYETNVGARGFLLSGGQKQRIAIARAMVSDPKILLLDEATSALDTKSEGIVQAALDVAAKGRTTIVIAHRLSTIRDADNIVVMSQGKIVEQGNHNDLLNANGAYFRLVEAQRINAEREREQADQVQELDQKDEEIFKTMSRRQSKAYSSDPDDEIANKLDRSKSAQSVSSKKLKDMPDEQEPHYSLWRLIKLTASFNKPEALWMFSGLFWSIIAGLGNPTQSVFFAYTILYLSIPYPYVGLRDNVNFWCWMYFMLAFVQLLSTVAQGTSFAHCSQRLIYRVRSRAFRTMLRQDISFFDHDENSAGALTSFLSTQTNHLAGLSGSTLGTILMTLTTLIAAMVVGLALAWRLALVCIACIPIMIGAGFFRFWLLARFEGRAKKAYESSASYACEATSAIRTVASLTREQDVWESYHQSLVEQQAKSLRSIVRSSLLYAASQSVMFLVMALGFWYGGTRIAAGEIGLLNFFIAFSSIIFGAQSAGTIFSFAPDMGKAKHAAHGLQKLFDRKPEIDTWSGDGEKLDEVEGHIEFRDVHFRYPTRPEQPVLRGLNLTVKPGQYVALVGASGCGKSTTIALLERFYDPLHGGVFIDSKSISSLNVNDYRKHISLVSQEPTLYQGTIKENILLGSTGEDDTISDERIEKACKDANIYNFILSLPDGFNTVVGSKGGMLSGGQKQRVAIARALLRDPKILLLDEATSALDSESEKIVQAALDAAAKGRTTIAVAHRLSTIQKADMIYVFDQGRIVENGTHNELLRLNGKYAELVNLQSLEKKR